MAIANSKSQVIGSEEMESILKSYERSEAKNKVEREHLSQTRAANILLQEQNRAAQFALEGLN